MASIFKLYRNAFTNIQRNTWILALAMFINRSGAMVLLFTSLYLTNNLHFTMVQAAMVMSYYGIGSVLGSYMGGWLTDRINYYNIMLFSLISCGIILLLMLVASSLFWISIIIFLYALTCDLFRPANSAAIASYSTSENRTRSVSLVRLAINLGFSVGPAIGGFVALKLGYHWLFIIDSMSSFAAALMIYLYLPKQKTEGNRRHSEVLNDNKTSAYRDKEYLFFIFLVALYGTCFFQFFASVPQYFSKVCNYDESKIGLLIALNGLLVVIIEMPLISILEKKKVIFPYIIAGVFCIPISFLILRFGNGMLLWAIVYTIIISMSEIFAMPFMMNYALSKPKKERQGQYSALYSISYGIAIILAPSIGLGIAAKYSFTSMFYFIICLSIFTALGFVYLNKKKG